MIVETRLSDQGEALTATRRLEDEPEIETGFRTWLEGWRAWAAKEIEDEPIREVYRWLFQMSEQAAAAPEDLELVGGVGCLSWRPEGHDEVRRHVLTVPVGVDFDDETGRLTVHKIGPAEGLVVELDMLDAARWPAPERLNDIREKAERFDNHVLSRDDVEILLRRLANNLDPNGRYEETDEPCDMGADAAVAFAPAIILRRRSNLGLLRIFQEIRRQLESSVDIPEGVKQLVDVVDTGDLPVGEGNGPAPEPATDLPLPANRQQLEIVRRVDGRRHTVVQGPPGTGKTHTIANLLAHLLARGQRVLVTAQTDRALRELRDKIPDALEALCVSVVGRERSDLSDLKVAVDSLARRAEEYDPSLAEAEIAEHQASLESLRREHALLHSRLVQSRERETVSREHGPYRGTLAEIARQHRADESAYGWLAQYVDSSSETPPLLDGEAAELLKLLRDPDLARDESEATGNLVPLDSIPDPSAFATLVDREREALLLHDRYANDRAHPAYEMVVSMDPATRAELRDRFRDLAKTTEELAARREPWMSEALADIHSGKPERWRHRYNEITRLLASCRRVIGRLDMSARIQVQGADPYALVVQAEELRRHLENGGRLGGILTPKPVKRAAELLASVRVNDTPPTTVGALATFIDWMSARRQLDAMDRLWPASVPIPSEDTVAERLGWHEAEVNQLGRVIQLGEALRAEEAWLDERGVLKPNWADLEAVRVFGRLVEAAEATDGLGDARQPLTTALDVVSEACRRTDAAGALQDLMAAIEDRNPVAYQTCIHRLEHLRRVRDMAARRDALRQRLADAAPGLAEAVEGTSGDEQWDRRLAHLASAWAWCEAAAWIDSESEANVEDLQRQLHAVEVRMGRAVADLTAARAWSLAVTRLGVRERQSLKSYALAVRKLGKGTGKYASHRRGEARSELKQCRTAVPAWVMPIYRIAEALEVERDMFDVVVIDEASQAGIEACFLQYLAPRIVVVGDDKQVSPSGVGLDHQQLISLRQQLLYDFDHGHVWENPTASFFDLARIRYGDVITLREHFRCVPEIIGFSNRIAYEPDRVPLIPLRQYGLERLEPIRTVHVEDGYRLGSAGKAVNPPEAEAIAEAVLKCCADPAYDGKTIGVISLTGRTQAERVEQLLLERMDPKEYRARELRCGDSADFQGSERDVVFLSMVAAHRDGERLTPLTAERYVQRFNVAGSRARDQMWVFHSMALEELTNRDDMRYQLLEYCYGLQRALRLEQEGETGKVPDDMQVDPFESLFEQHVYNAVFERGYTVVPQWEVYGYRIDLVVVGGQSRLAVECDGDRWHGADRYEQDLARQRELERCGWTFFRVRASSFYRDPQAALAPLWDLLDAHEIRPIGWTTPSRSAAADAGPTTISAVEVAQLPPPPRIETIADSRQTSPESVVEDVGEDVLRYEAQIGDPGHLVTELVRTPDEIENPPSQAGIAVRPDQAMPATHATGSDVVSGWSDATASEPPAEVGSEDEVQPSGRPEAQSTHTSSEALDPDVFRGRAFEDVALGVIPAQIAMLVHEQGRVPVDGLPLLYSERFAISVEESKAKWLIRFAWSAVGRKFARWNGDQTELLPGPERAHVVDPPGEWTFAQVEALARELHEAGLEESQLFDRVVSTVHPGKRAPRLIARIVGSAIYSATHRRKV